MLSRPLVKVETVPWLSLEVCCGKCSMLPKLSKSDLVCSRKLWSSLLESANLGAVNARLRSAEYLYPVRILCGSCVDPEPLSSLRILSVS